MSGFSMVYFCTIDGGSWVAYLCAGGLTDSEWLIPGTGGE
jgi:hypothetical protein